jgi:hypothetical protein
VLMIASYITLVHAPPTYTYKLEQVTMSVINQPWVFRASTDDPNVKQVLFTWYYPYPSGSAVRTQLVTVGSPFIDTLVPDQAGWWYITADFQDANGGSVYSTNHLEDVGPYDVGPPQNLVPEVPVLGTVGASAAMALGLAYRMKRKAQR